MNETKEKRSTGKAKLTPRDFSMAIALVVIWAFFASQQPAFLSSRNLSLLMIELSVTAILALGMLLVLLPGHLDLSAGSGVGLTGGIAAVLVFNAEWPAGIAMVVAFLGGLVIFKGAHWLVIKSQTIPVVEGGSTNIYSLLTTYYLPPWAGLLLAAAVSAALVASKLRARASRQRYGFEVDDNELTFLKLFLGSQVLFLGVVITNQYQGLPLAAVILGVVVVAVQMLCQHTTFGRYLYAIGGNEEAAIISGVPVQKIVIGAFSLMGIVVALSGLMQTAYAGASTTTVGNLMELDAIAACVIGGTSLKGGRGTVLGVVFGSLIMVSLLNGMTLMAVSPEIKMIARGSALALAVWLDVRLSQK